MGKFTPNRYKVHCMGEGHTYNPDWCFDFNGKRKGSGQEGGNGLFSMDPIPDAPTQGPPGGTTEQH